MNSRRCFSLFSGRDKKENKYKGFGFLVRQSRNESPWAIGKMGRPWRTTHSKFGGVYYWDGGSWGRITGKISDRRSTVWPDERWAVDLNFTHLETFSFALNLETAVLHQLKKALYCSDPFATSRKRGARNPSSSHNLGEVFRLGVKPIIINIDEVQLETVYLTY